MGEDKIKKISVNLHFSISDFEAKLPYYRKPTNKRYCDFCGELILYRNKTYVFPGEIFRNKFFCSVDCAKHYAESLKDKDNQAAKELSQGESCDFCEKPGVAMINGQLCCGFHFALKKKEIIRQESGVGMQILGRPRKECCNML